MIETVYAALARNDLAAMRAHVVEDVEIVERLEVPGARRYRGIDDWERGYAEEAETIDDFHVDLIGVEELGGHCVADVVIRMRGKGSGAEVEERLAHLVDFDGERITRWRAFSALEEARAVARVECIAELYGMWARGEVEGAIARVHPDIEWTEPEETIGAQRRLGREGALEGIEQWSQSFDSYDGELTGIEAVAETVMVEFVQRVRAGGSAVELENRLFHVWWFRDGVPAKMTMYFDRERALREAAG